MNAEWRIKVHGLVQGVGFRRTVARAARQLGIVGTVCNCSDGTVDIVAQGPSATLEMFLEGLHASPGAGSIERMDVERGSAATRFSSFDVVR